MKASLQLQPMYCSRDYNYSSRYKEYYKRLEQRLKYLQKVLLDFKMRWLALLNKDREYFPYNSGDLVYLISLDK